MVLNIQDAGSDGLTPSRGAPCQYLIEVESMREAEMSPTARALWRRVAVEYTMEEADHLPEYGT